MVQVVCASCASPFHAQRKDRRWCTVECKRQLKRDYDNARYPSIAEETISRARDWQRNNLERKREYDRVFRIRTAERRAERRALYNATYRPDPESRRLAAAKRRATKVGNGTFRVTKRDYARALSRAGSCCTYCRESFTPDNPLEWDHVIPISRGGRHSVGNLVPACKRCNRSKQVKLISEWRAGKVVWVGDKGLTLAA